MKRFYRIHECVLILLLVPSVNRTGSNQVLLVGSSNRESKLKAVTSTCTTWQSMSNI